MTNLTVLNRKVTGGRRFSGETITNNHTQLECAVIGINII